MLRETAFTVRVHKFDHQRVAAYYKNRGILVRLEHDPDVRWPDTSFSPTPKHDRYEELD